MNRNDKIKVALWLRRKIQKLEQMPHYVEIIQWVDQLRETAEKLEAEIDQET